MKNTYQFPYFQIKRHLDHLKIALYLRRKFLPYLRPVFPYHYLITQDTRKYLKFIKETASKSPYFLRFDIKQYFPSISHSVLLKEIPFLYQKLSGKPAPRRLMRILKKELPLFLSLSPYKDSGLPIGNPLSHILSGIYLLKLDLSLKTHFLRFCDDYLLFAKKESDFKDVLSQTISPVLNELNLSLNLQKLKSGKFHKDKCSFLGFEFFSGYTLISQEKISDFQKRIIRITHLTKKKPVPAIVKLLNNQILSFGHYYKFASAGNVFKDLDAFIRARIRRYILKNRDILPKTANLFLTNQVLKELGLKSLIDIKQTFDQKFQRKVRKSVKISSKTGQKISSLNSSILQEISDKYLLKQILFKLNELEKAVKKLTK